MSIPLDLSEVGMLPTLADWIQEEVETLGPDVLRFSFLPPADREAARVLLSILAFAYATGRFDSESIAGACRSNAPIRLVSGQQMPLPADLSLFRRKHRGLLVTVLARVLGRALQRQMHNAAVPGGALRRFAHENAVERLDIARHMDRTEG